MLLFDHTKCSRRFLYFLVVFYSCIIFQSMVGLFLNSAIQSLERQFQIPSSKSGLIISASRFGSIPTVLFLAYFGNKGNKARWIGFSSILVAFGCFLAASPNVLFPPKSQFFQDDKDFTTLDIIKLLNMTNNKTNGELTAKIDKLELNESLLLVEPHAISDSADVPLISLDEPADAAMNEECLNNLGPNADEDQLLKEAQLPFSYCSPSVAKIKQAMQIRRCGNRKAQKSKNDIAFYIVIAAVTLFGIGQSVPWTVGTPLIDDSVKRKNAPYHFAVLKLVRIIGPVAGVWLAAVCFKLHVTLNEPAGITPLDPRWIGAWWLGFLIMGVLLTFPSISFFFFSKKDFTSQDSSNENSKNGKIPLESKSDSDEEASIKLLETKPDTEIKHGRIYREAKDFFASLLKCLKSPIYVSLLFGRVFDSFSWRGLMSFIPKFIENHYGVAQHEVSFFMGVVGTLSFAGGMLAGSFLMKRLNLDGRRAAGFVLFTTVVSVFLGLSKIFLKCESINSKVGQLASHANFSLSMSCNKNCNCDLSDLYPVCNKDGQSYFSPCHAGCANFTLNDDDPFPSFSNCSCSDGGLVSRSFCINECKFALFLYYAITVLNGIICGTSVIPYTLINLRCVPQEVRAIGIAFNVFVVNLITAAPSPIIAGSIIDTTCLLWNKVCGRRGACLLYDSTVLRVRLHVIHAIFRGIGAIFDLFVLYLAANLVLMEKKPKEQEKQKHHQQQVLHQQNGYQRCEDNKIAKLDRGDA